MARLGRQKETATVQDQQSANLELILAAASRCDDGVIMVVPRKYILPKERPVGQFAGLDVYAWPSKGK